MTDEQQLIIIVLLLTILILLIWNLSVSRNKLGLVDLVIVAVIKMTTRNHVIWSYSQNHTFSYWEVVSLILENYAIDSGEEVITLAKVRDILEREMISSINYANERGYSGEKERMDSQLVHKWLNNLDKIIRLTPIPPKHYLVDLRMLSQTLRDAIEEVK